MEEVVAVDDVEQVKATVGEEFGIEGESEEAVVAPISDLFDDIDEELAASVFGDNKDAAGLFPDELAAALVKGESGRKIPPGR